MATQQPIGQPRSEPAAHTGAPLLDGDLRDWLAQLPDDDPSAICDLASGRPLRWDDGRGWIE